MVEEENEELVGEDEFKADVGDSCVDAAAVVVLEDDDDDLSPKKKSQLSRSTSSSSLHPRTEQRAMSIST